MPDASHLHKPFTVTVTGLSSADITYKGRFTNANGPLRGAVYSFTMPSHAITIDGEFVVPVTGNGTVNLTLSGYTLSPSENGGLSLDFFSDAAYSIYLTGTHVNNVLGNSNVPWNNEFLPDTPFYIQARIGTDADGLLFQKSGQFFTLDSSGTVTAGSTAITVNFTRP
ncbi:MAG: hypothetical protein LBG22_04535 [Treponema sp.]|jgi:hypothetical protein|nr:hypothetical protein [Treponema sp.]